MLYPFILPSPFHAYIHCFLQEQASWVCGCDPATVTRLEESFKNTLQQQGSLETWASWLEGVVDSLLSTQLTQENYIRSARQFLLR